MGCQYDLSFCCQEGACMVVRNTFLSFDEPKENLVQQRSHSKPFDLGCTCADDSADDESQCSTDVEESDASPSSSTSNCQYDLIFRCQEGACVVVRNTFLSFDEPKENLVRLRALSEPFDLGCFCAEDSGDDESQCSTDVGEPDSCPSSVSIVSDHCWQDIDCRESNEAQVVVRNTFLDFRVPREQRRRNTPVH